MASTAVEPAAGQRLGDHPEVAADVVGPLQNGPVGLAPGVHPHQRVEDRRRADAEPEIAGDQTQHVPRLQRCGSPEQPGQQVELATLRAGTLRRGDLVECLDDLADRHARRPLGQQCFRSLAEVAPGPHGRGHRVGLDAYGAGDRTDRQLLGQPEVDTGELRRNEALAQVAHAGELVVGRSPDQLDHPVDQRQPAGGSLQVAVRLGHRLVPHAPSPHPGIMMPEDWALGETARAARPGFRGTVQARDAYRQPVRVSRRHAARHHRGASPLSTQTRAPTTS